MEFKDVPNELLIAKYEALNSDLRKMQEEKLSATTIACVDSHRIKIRIEMLHRMGKQPGGK